MSLETANTRKRKRIIEHTLGPFDNAFEAIRFGNTIESLVNEKLGTTKFRQSIGALNTPLAITKDYIGDTMLKTVFLEVQGNDAARFVCEQLRYTAQVHNDCYSGRVMVHDELIRAKPLPQTIGA